MLDDLSHRVQEVVRRAQRLTARREDAAASTAQADALHDAHRREAASLEALEGAMRATIDEVLASIEATTARRDGARAAVPEAEQLSRYRADQAVRAEGEVERARDQFARTNADLDAAVGRLETALLLPGTARAALGRDLVQAVDLLEGQASVSTSPMVAVAGSVFEETHNADDVTDRVILNRYDELQAALAGGYDIAVDEEDGIKYFHVSDDTGRQPLPTVAARVEADAETARTRLAASERDVIIRFLLGELGDELRERLLEAEDLVAAANTALADVRTSHGKGARLEWKVDPDEADEVRTARQLLLLRPRTAEEDAELQTALLSLIRTQREQDPGRLLPRAPPPGARLSRLAPVHSSGARRRPARFGAHIVQPAGPLARRTARPVLPGAVRSGICLLRSHRGRGPPAAPARRRLRKGRRTYPRPPAGAPGPAQLGLPDHK